ncbi:citrate-binding protein-like [Hordeum vulgare subsp. vulgare]|uniref:Alginate lyase 2 domain-containing protein n=1 Tax=Hordeum vulgare subsp. vulgare TaxID=112509 RepID=A0A8I6WD43_HORVV|nr:citrate-binding protein-like [Hordeum vulgare subsp. vulgare]
MASLATFSWISLYLLAVLLAPASAQDPTAGFTAVSLSESNFQLQKPYNMPSSARYSFDGTVRRMWVLSSDEPFSPQSDTKPRTEMRMTGHDYSSGVWQFEGSVYVPSGTSGVSIMQVFGGGETATTLMLHVYNGALRYYNQKPVEDNIYNRWLRVNVIHDVGASRLTVFINGQQKLSEPGRGGNSHYFKFGVYTQREASSRMESRWKNVRILKKN